DRHAPATHRVIGDAAPARRDRALPRWPEERWRGRRAAARDDRGRRPSKADGDRGDRPGRGHGRARQADRRSGRGSDAGSEPLLDLAGDPPEAPGADPRASLDEEDLVRAHHGSLAREQRTEVEDALKEGRLRAIVATSSLELGIDMGAVDLVIQVESPGSVASGLQRIGRAGHQVGEPSRGKIFPKFRGDLLEAAVVTQRMRDGLIEETRYPRNPLD